MIIEEGNQDVGVPLNAPDAGADPRSDEGEQG